MNQRSADLRRVWPGSPVAAVPTPARMSMGRFPGGVRLHAVLANKARAGSQISLRVSRHVASSLEELAHGQAGPGPGGGARCLTGRRRPRPGMVQTEECCSAVVCRPGSGPLPLSVLPAVLSFAPSLALEAS
jgi:hypothetical protein